MKRCMIVMTMVVLAALAAGGCAQVPAQWKGELSMRDIYLNLMTDEQAAVLRQMEKEEVDEEKRILYCQEIGVYQQWRAVPEDLRPTIRKGQIVEGMSPSEVQMAWGPPAVVENVTDAAERAAGHRSDLWSFMPRTDKQGTVSYDRQACFLDERLEWYKDLHKKSLWSRFAPRK
ncbi:MAG: hypothetical protein JXL80_14645 [Planctomycetes bacterium]|nr:hypothetical protein [Planctomycetota bacterium]